MSNKSIEQLLKKGDAGEWYVLKNTVVDVEFENNKLKGVNYSEISGKALRLIKDGRIGFSTSTKDDDDDGTIDKALSVSKFGRRFDFPFCNDQSSAQGDYFSEKVAAYPIEDMVSAGMKLINDIRKTDSEILAAASFEKRVKEVRILNSCGIEKVYKKTYFTVSCGGKITKEGNFIYVYDSQSSTSIIPDEEIESIKKNVLTGFALSKKNVPFTSKKLPVIITPWAMGDILEPVVICSSGKAVQKGVSPWRDKLGKTIFDKRINIYDDPTIPNLTGSIPFDDEGVPAKRTPIVENGVLKSFYHNLDTASVLKMEPTGNGLRGGLENIPSPSVTNIIMNGGDKSFKEILTGIKEGILIDQLLGTFTSNHLGGQVSGTISLGYKIENGELTGRIKDAMFSVSIFDVLKDNIAEISKDVITRGGSSLPYVMLEDVFISAKG